MRPIDFAGTPRNVDESLDPLIEQLPAMHQHQRVHAALGDQPRGDTVLPNAVVAASTPVSCASIASAAAFCSGRSSPWKAHVQGLAGLTFVANDGANAEVRQRLLRTSSRQPRGRPMCCG